jgi:hypothetical protein
MKPQKVGRVLGIGLRVAGRIAGERLAGDAQKTAATAQIPESVQAGSKPQSRTATVKTGSLARGVGGFLRPFSRIGGILWLEVTGAFFLLPVVFFAPTLWRVRASWAHGPEHRLFLATVAIMAVFFYLSVSSFWRARRR